ncbi:hypothetical protein JCM12178A_00660 [Salidesulfovibrio brasiliensis]
MINKYKALIIAGITSISVIAERKKFSIYMTSMLRKSVAMQLTGIHRENDRVTSAFFA